jgi:ribosomal protein S18 acetylase RimI-like enzyme
MPEIGIRSLSPADFEALKQIEHEYQTDHVWQMERSFEPGDFSFRFREIRLPRVIRVEMPKVFSWNDEDNLATMKGLVADLQDIPIGYLLFKVIQDTRTAWVVELNIKRRHRRQGIGSALMLAAQQWAASNRLKRIVLEMQSKNYPAIRFAQKLGFEFSGYNDHYYAKQDIALFFARYLR